MYAKYLIINGCFVVKKSLLICACFKRIKYCINNMERLIYLYDEILKRN